MNRKVLYGYQIEGGKLTLQSQEAAVVSRVFALYLEGKLQREISDTLNTEGILYSPDRPVSALRETLRCPCGGRLKRWFNSVHKPDTLYLRCAECGGEVIIPDANLLAEVERQAAEYTPPTVSACYTPSKEVVRLRPTPSTGDWRSRIARRTWWP